MCGIGQVLQIGFGMLASAAQSKARIEEQNRQYEANRAAAQAAYAAGKETASLTFLQNNKKIRQEQFDFELLSKLRESQLSAASGASNLKNTGSIRSSLADLRSKGARGSRRYVDERKNLADSYERDLDNLRVTMVNQINSVSQGSWTAGDSLSMMAPVVNGFSSLMIQQQNNAAHNQSLARIGGGALGLGSTFGGFSLG